MFDLICKRLYKQLSFYIAISIGILLSIAQFWVDQYPLEEPKLSISGGISFSPYLKWMGMSNGFSNYTELFIFILPILVSLPLADLYAKDKRNGFDKFLIIRGKHKQYFNNLLLLNFIIGVFIAIIPLILNIYLSFMKLPNITPDKIINKEISLMSTTTFFPELFYTHPFLHMLFYVLLIGMFGGMFATLALSISLYINKSFIILLLPFASQFILNTLFNIIQHREMMASNFLLEHSPNGVNLTSMILQLSLGLIISIALYMFGVKKNVIR
ncbi:hypothetical protein ACPCZR_30295 [Bacillus bombysepticus]